MKLTFLIIITGTVLHELASLLHLITIKNKNIKIQAARAIVDLGRINYATL